VATPLNKSVVKPMKKFKRKLTRFGVPHRPRLVNVPERDPGFLRTPAAADVPQPVMFLPTPAVVVPQTPVLVDTETKSMSKVSNN
jgi:hypothetical protein